MTAGDRFKQWIDKTASGFADRIATWGMNMLARGVTKTLEDMEPGAIEGYKDVLTKIRDNPLTPPEMKKFYDKALVPGNWFVELIAGMTIAIGAIPALLSAGVPLGNLIKYGQDAFLQSWRLDPMSVITAWRRDPEKYAKYLQDLNDQGWSDERIEALKFITEIIPNAADIVRFALREVYTPEIAEAYGQFQDIPAGAYPDAAKAGLSADMFNKYWAAHWALPSASDGFELLHRGILTEDQLKGLLKANDIMPYWRDQLIKLSWNIPTRVDVRRFWDMRTIDEARLREIYTGLGYHAQDLEDYVLWTKIYVDFPDLLARYKNGWITLDDVKRELIAMGMKPERADTMIEEKIKKAAPERVAKERELTAAEIIKGVKKEVITWDEGRELLMDMGYDQNEAEFKLAIELAAMAGSPESYAEFKDLTQKYRRASGLEGKPMNEEIRAAAQAIILLTGERDSLQKSIAQEQRGLIGEAILPAEATARLKTLQKSLAKAEAALSAAKTEYNRLVAEGKFA